MTKSNTRTRGVLIILCACIITASVAFGQGGLSGVEIETTHVAGNIYMLQSLIVGELFGMTSFGTVLGLLQMITQTASGLAPYAVSLLVAGLGGYRLGLMPLVVVALLSGVVMLRLRPPPPAP